LPPPTEQEAILIRDRIEAGGQQERILALPSGEIVVGRSIHEACLQAGVAADVEVIERPPSDLVEFVLRHEMPRTLGALDRACVAVLAREAWQAAGRERKGAARSRDREDPSRSFGGERWFEHAARVTGCTPNAAKTLARVRDVAADVFDAVRARDLRSLAVADRLSRIQSQIERAAALACQITGRGKQAGGETSVDAVVVRAEDIELGSVDVMHADLRNLDASVSTAVAKLAARALGPDGVMVVVPRAADLPRVVAKLTARLECIGVGVLAEGAPILVVGHRGTMRRVTLPSARDLEAVVQRLTPAGGVARNAIREQSRTVAIEEVAGGTPTAVAAAAPCRSAGASAVTEPSRPGEFRADGAPFSVRPTQVLVNGAAFTFPVKVYPPAPAASADAEEDDKRSSGSVRGERRAGGRQRPVAPDLVTLFRDPASGGFVRQPSVED
jgi:hypothetical protein